MKLVERALGFELSAGGWRAVHIETRVRGTRALGVLEGRLERLDPAVVAAALESAIRDLDVAPGTRLGVALARPVAHLKRIDLPRSSRERIREAVRARSGSVFPTGKTALLVDVCGDRGNGMRRSSPLQGQVAAVPEELMSAVAETARRLKLRLASADLTAAALRLLLPRSVDGALVLGTDGIEWLRYGGSGVEAAHYFPLPLNGRPAESKNATSGIPDSLRAKLGSGSFAVIGSDDMIGRMAGEYSRRDRHEEGNGANGRAIAGLDGSQFAAAAGAALQALGARREFDLRPEPFRAASLRRRRRRRSALLASLAFLAVAYVAAGLLQLRAQVTRLEGAVSELRPRAEEVLELENRIGEAGRRAALLARLEAGQPRWTAVLAELARALPDDAYLTSVKEQADRLRLEGYARATSDVVSALESSSMFSGVRLIGSVVKEPTAVGERERFTLELSRVTNGRSP